MVLCIKKADSIAFFFFSFSLLWTLARRRCDYQQLIDLHFWAVSSAT